jgi:hypothetical protein
MVCVCILFLGFKVPPAEWSCFLSLPSLSVCVCMRARLRSGACVHKWFAVWVVWKFHMLIKFRSNLLWIELANSCILFSSYDSFDDMLLSVAFTTWLLGRLFYLMSSSALASVLDLCTAAQISILQLLERHRCSVFISIIDEYLNCLAGEFDIQLLTKSSTTYFGESLAFQRNIPHLSSESASKPSMTVTEAGENWAQLVTACAGNMALWNVRLSPKYAELRFRRLFFSLSLPWDVQIQQCYLRLWNSLYTYKCCIENFVITCFLGQICSDCYAVIQWSFLN